MVVFSNRRLGASAELLVSDDVALEMLRTTAAQALPVAAARWEHELVRWLEHRAAEDLGLATLDVGEIAWTPDHFESQRAFLLAAIERAAEESEHGLAFDRWRRLIEAHPRDSVQVGRRWNWPPTI
ncbi:MAG: hypothetical protein ABJE66_18860 [Deltaproteobacteria bacterium]